MGEVYMGKLILTARGLNSETGQKIIRKCLTEEGEREKKISQRGERYEIRKLSNTYNANVIFSVKLNEYASGLTDQEFITALI